MAQLRGHKIGPLPGSLLVRRIIPVATTSREIISELTGLEEAVIVRCKKLISFDRKFQGMMLDPDPDRRVKSDFFIELYSLIHDSHVASFPWFSQNKFIREMLVKYQQEPRTIKAVTDFRTGKQVSDSWREIFHELLAGGPRIILVLVAATTTAIQRIREETDMEVRCCNRLQSSDNIFAAECDHFTDEEKSAILRYCRNANNANPRVFGDCGLLLVFVHRCPNNTIPILHANHEDWVGLFPRDD